MGSEPLRSFYVHALGITCLARCGHWERALEVLRAMPELQVQRNEATIRGPCHCAVEDPYGPAPTIEYEETVSHI